MEKKGALPDEIYTISQQLLHAILGSLETSQYLEPTGLSKHLQNKILKECMWRG
jgi:hypothetical protein